MPKVSVIIPTHNRAHFIADTIQSVLDQTFSDFEIIVVDNESTDNTKQVVDGFKDSRIKYIYQENRGVANARNNGIKASSGEYIAFLDSDDMWLPENLELKVKMLDSYPDAALVSSDYYIFDSDTGANLGRFWDNRPFRHLLKLDKGVRQPLAFATLLTPSVVMARRRIFIDEVGYFDESLQFSEDWDIWLRILPRFPIRVIDMPVARYRHHDAQYSDENPVRRYLCGIAMLNKAVRDDCLSREDRRYIRKKLASKHSGYGWYIIKKGEIDPGRKELFKSIKTDPWHIRPYIYLAVSTLGSPGVMIVQRLKTIFKGIFAPTSIKEGTYQQDEQG